MLVAALVLATLAALLHVFIFALESVLWETPNAQKVFGMGTEEAHATREMAFNQGFYNLFLALVTLVGVVLLASGTSGAGTALVIAGLASMAGAALVLFVWSPDKRSAATKQGTLPVLGLALLLIAAVA